MASMLGKRKRRAPEASKIELREESEESDASELDAQEIFRRHFEAQFKPLPAAQEPSKAAAEEPAEDSEEASDWDGISDDEENGVQVVEHTEAHARTAAMSKEELKSFMVFLPLQDMDSTDRTSELKTPQISSSSFCAPRQSRHISRRRRRLRSCKSEERSSAPTTPRRIPPS